MPFLEHASNTHVNGGSFMDMSGNTIGNVYLGPNPNTEALNKVRRIVEQDTPYNDYSDAKGMVKLPVFTKELLLGHVNLPADEVLKRKTATSCCFDLAGHLGLLPGQLNSGFGTQFEQTVPIANVVTRGTCCCARISRHGLVHLVSRFFQNASVQETSGSGKTITIHTTIGRFKCYDIDDRTFVHFDASMRSPPVAELVNKQDVDDIVRVARGQLLSIDCDSLSKKEWRTDHTDQIPRAAAGNFFCVPNAIMYMSKEKNDIWKTLKRFGSLVFTCTVKYINALRKPESFCRLADEANFDPTNVKAGTPPEMLAYTFNMLRLISTKNPFGLTPEFYMQFSEHCLFYLFKAHQHYRDDPRVELVKLYETSSARFLRIFCKYQEQETATTRTSDGGEGVILDELRSVMKTTDNNIALVVYQAYFGRIVVWNAARMLGRMREAPVEWLQFVSAEDDDIFLG